MYSGRNIQLHPLQDGFVECVIDVASSKVNIFNQQTVKELDVVITELSNRTDIKGLCIRSAKEGFIAGADITEFGSIFAEGPDKIQQLLNRSNHNFNRIEELPFPVVAAINGFALGGGCELILACDYRIASVDARIGLPETRLGIIPGWGGTVRLPRIAGIETAVEWIATAKDFKAIDAQQAGVVDGIVDIEILQQAALNILRQCVEGQLNYQQRRRQKQSPLLHSPIEKAMAFTTSKAMVAAKAGQHYPAPIAAVNAIEKSASLSRDEALQIESATFIEMAQTSVASGLTAIFVNDQAISKKAKDIAKTSTSSTSHAAVLGAGIMGGGIAYQSALKKIPIKMKDIDQKGLDLGLDEANKLLSRRVERGRLSAPEMGDVLNRIEPTLSWGGFDKVDIVVEAVVENIGVKKSVLAEVEKEINENTIVCSNTSTISISHLAEDLQRPENFCGMHFFNPVHAMPLVEIIRGEQTSDQAVATTVAYANAMGKKAIVVNDCPGFLVNRVLFPYFMGFALLVRDGVDFQRIDKVMEKWGWPMGPAYLLDVVGLDTGIHAEAVMAEAFPDRLARDFVAASEVLFKAERLGQKNQKGFYDYHLDKKSRLQKTVSDEAIELIKPHVSHDSSVEEMSDEQIVARMMTPMITELARCLEENIVASPAEADMALIYGIGFPPFRGGLFHWVDAIGIDALFKMMEPWASLGELYLPTEGMQKIKKEQSRYYSELNDQEGA